MTKWIAAVPKPPITPLEKIRRRKERARRADMRLLQQGKVSPEELQHRNCLIPVEITDSPAWKEKCLAALLEQMTRNAARLQTNLPPESFLPNRPGTTGVFR